MTYLRPAHRPMGRARGRGGALLGLGEVGAATAMDLANQVNRFGPDAPAAYRFVTTPFPAQSQITPALALAAATIYQRRATDAYTQFHDQGSLDALNRANAGLADPVGFVTANLNDVVTTIQSFAESVGLPAGDATPPGDATLWILSTPVLIGFGFLALIYLTKDRP